MISDNLGYVVGLDTGGTRSRALLVDRRGDEVSEVEGPPLNLRQVRVDDASETIYRLVNQLFHQAEVVDYPSAIAMGIAGAGDPELREVLKTSVRRHFQRTHLYVQHDAFIAWYGAFSGKPGVIAISGTGSIALGRNAAGEEARAGGWGWLLGDEGSGWWIGLHAVRAALAAWEGSGPATGITDVIRERFNVEDAYGIITPLYADRIARHEITALAEPVTELARQGDEVARELLHRAGRELGGLAARAARKLKLEHNEVRVALLGGVATGAGDLLRTGVNEAVCDMFGDEVGDVVQPPDHDALRGAVLWARDTLQQRSYA